MSRSVSSGVGREGQVKLSISDPRDPVLRHVEFIDVMDQRVLFEEFVAANDPFCRRAGKVAEAVEENATKRTGMNWQARRAGARSAQGGAT